MNDHGLGETAVGAEQLRALWARVETQSDDTAHLAEDISQLLEAVLSLEKTDMGERSRLEYLEDQDKVTRDRVTWLEEELAKQKTELLAQEVAREKDVLDSHRRTDQLQEQVDLHTVQLRLVPSLVSSLTTAASTKDSVASDATQQADPTPEPIKVKIPRLQQSDQPATKSGPAGPDFESAAQCLHFWTAMTVEVLSETEAKLHCRCGAWWLFDRMPAPDVAPTTSTSQKPVSLPSAEQAQAVATSPSSESDRKAISNWWWNLTDDQVQDEINKAWRRSSAGSVEEKR